MTTTSRRAMLAGITAVPAIVTGTSLGAATAADGDPEAQRLWIRYSRLSKASSENMRAMSAAMERLPRWAGTGQTHIDCQGNPVGEARSGWPEAENPKLPPPGVWSLVRLSTFDVKQHYRSMVDRWPQADSGKLRAVYRANMRKVIKRLREQREERQKVGLDRIDVRAEKITNIIVDMQERFRDMLSPDRVHVLAALVLIELEDEFIERFDVRISTLTCLRPQLSGAIAASVDQALADLAKDAEDERQI